VVEQFIYLLAIHVQINYVIEQREKYFTPFNKAIACRYFLVLEGVIKKID
jgi:hypothetical protein